MLTKTPSMDKEVRREEIELIVQYEADAAYVPDSLFLSILR
jgi:hypothetical protein